MPARCLVARALASLVFAVALPAGGHASALETTTTGSQEISEPIIAPIGDNNAHSTQPEMSVRLSALRPNISAADLPAGKEPLAMIFWESKPVIFASGTGTGAEGWLADLTTGILRAAGYEPVWYGPMTPGRVLDEMHLPQTICVPNWAARPDRASFKFTAPIQRDGGVHMIWVKAPGDWVRKYHTARELLLDRERRGAFSAGAAPSSAALEPALRAAENGGNIRLVSGGPANRLRLVATGRADYTISTSDRTPGILEQLGIPQGEVIGFKMPDLGSEKQGRIMCSTATPAHVIQRINDGISRFYAQVALGDRR